MSQKVKSNILKILIREEIEKQLQVKPVYNSLDKYLVPLPSLKKAIILLFTTKYRYFIKDIKLVSAKPTKFMVFLNNNYSFVLKYLGDGIYEAKVSGKKYDLGTSGEAQRACNAISDLSEMGMRQMQVSEEEAAGATAGGAGGSGSSGDSGGGGGSFGGGPDAGTFVPLDGNSDNPLDVSGTGDNFGDDFDTGDDEDFGEED